MYDCTIIETPRSIIIYNVNLCVQRHRRGAEELIFLVLGVMVGGSAEPSIKASVTHLAQRNLINSRYPFRSLRMFLMATNFLFLALQT